MSGPAPHYTEPSDAPAEPLPCRIVRPGTLFVVGTPIGNLEDVTIRALRILRDAQLIAAEDTRRTAKLLAHYDIRTSVISLREHNETRETPRLLDRLQAGQDIALVSDAGTPVVSDPGARLIRAARERGLTVSPIPGPSAVTAALSASGFPAHRFTFMGYPPSSGGDRRAWFADLRRETGTVVFFESPHRVTRTLEDLRTILVNRPIMIGREITKSHEEFVEWPSMPSSEKGSSHWWWDPLRAGRGFRRLTKISWRLLLVVWPILWASSQKPRPSRPLARSTFPSQSSERPSSSTGTPDAPSVSLTTDRRFATFHGASGPGFRNWSDAHGQTCAVQWSARGTTRQERASGEWQVGETRQERTPSQPPGAPLGPAGRESVASFWLEYAGAARAPARRRVAVRGRYGVHAAACVC